MKILLIEDDDVLLSNLHKALRREGFAVDEAQSVESAEIAMEVNEYDCVVLDLGLPDGSGFDLLKQWRSNQNQVPVVVITARSQVDERVKGLDLGADDYLSKPADPSELIARVRAVIRRNNHTSLPIISVGELEIIPAKHQARIKEHLLDLTAREFSVLEYLAANHDRLVTRSMLMEHVWGSDFETLSNVIDVYIKNLRSKISQRGGHQYIKTIRGKGYMLAAEK